ncbi:glycosyl hydrolase family 18 protein [Luteimonas sp. 50]|uniref:chitinase n=1 Tax=Cognatiluteimonas sedimenti TaxID=2927791 RepID=A0ABT0A6M5_9GAMM|nr:glycosyl hydrolase family 18 protein [Lysobacter sedimenti]MCJ0826583.1 glycosyl hydrolase family 18 protein [Lysobacter sedimenti]
MSRTQFRSATATAALGLLAVLVVQATPRTPNRAPTASIAAPTAGATFTAGTGIAITATASNADGSIARVDFYVDGIRIGRDTSAPYGITWSNAGVGTHALKAVATDNRRATGSSATVSVGVVATSDAIAPGVPTGLATSARSDASISLRWNASSDNVGGSGIAGYDVYRNGSIAGSTTSASYTDTGLAAATGYSYTVRARDKAGNASAQGAALVAATTASSATTKRVLGYFTQWGIYNAQPYSVRTLDAQGTAGRLTHLAYAFGNVRNNKCEVGVLKAVDPDTGEGGDAYADYSRSFSAAESVDGVGDTWGAPLRGNWNQLKKLKKKHPNLKVLISLGGWTLSRGFASAARPENRAAFVASCIDAYITGNLPLFDSAGGAGAAAGVFDGFDIDWEYPAACGLACGSSADTDNFTGLLAEFRRQLDAVRPGLQLTVAVGAGIDKIRVTRPDLYHPYVDAINVMTYDFHGAWDAKTNFHSALFNSPNDPASGDARYYNSNDAIQAFLDRGVPAAKLNLGMASYGRGWSSVASSNNGLYQAGVAASGSDEPGVETYRVLKALSWPKYTDAYSKARWIYDGKTFWSFDDPATITDKMAYVQVQGLGGAFLWDFSGDDAQGSLLAAISAGLQ